jgi:tetratricopeptide (TPR) repeat protein
MKISIQALAIALAGIMASAPAMAQYGAPPPPSTGTPQTPNEDDEDYQGRQEQTTIRSGSGSAASRSQEKAKAPGQTTADTLTSGRKLDLSKEARKAIIELQTAVNANDTASIPAKLAAAQAVAKTNDDKYVIATNQVKAASTANDLAGLRAGIDALRASGGAEPADVVARYNNLGKRYYDAKQLDQAAAAFDQALAVDANNVDSLKMLASTRETQGRAAEAVTLMAKSFTAAKAAGVKPKENDYKFAARIAYDAKAPAAGDITRAWIADYPNPTNWRDALRIYRDVNGLEGDAKIDVMRLARAANALNGEGDYFAYVNELVTRGYLNEAKAVIDEGGAKKAIDVNKNAFKQFAPKLAKAPARSTIDAVAKQALGAGSGKTAMEAGDSLYGIGAFAEAAPLFKAAATKGGVDANLANLRLGMALARAGDKAGATAALSAVTGPQANIAKYWLIWVNGQA